MEYNSIENLKITIIKLTKDVTSQNHFVLTTSTFNNT